MRLAFALVPLLLAASAALADPPPQRAPSDAAGTEHHHRQMAPSHQLIPATYPAYHHDAATDGNCYLVFGDLRCDRIAKTAHK